MAIFVYNNSVYSLTNKAPHKLLKGYRADFTQAPKDSAIRGEAPSAIERAD